VSARPRAGLHSHNSCRRTGRSGLDRRMRPSPGDPQVPTRTPERLAELSRAKPGRMDLWTIWRRAACSWRGQAHLINRPIGPTPRRRYGRRWPMSRTEFGQPAWAAALVAGTQAGLASRSRCEKKSSARRVFGACSA
jgi:hypothetical protein